MPSITSLDESISRARREEERKLYEPGLNQLSVVEKDYGFIGIMAFPNLDSIVAASIAYSLLKSRGFYTWIEVKPLPPRVIEEPMLILGFNPEVLKEVEFRAPSIAVARASRQVSLKVSLVAHPESSISSLIVGMFSELMAVGDKGLLGLSMSYWLGLDRGKRGDFVGPEKFIAELLEVENRVFSSLTLKLFDWFKVSTEESLASTLDPYYPGLTGDVDGAKKFLESDEKLKKLIGVSIAEADEEALSVLGQKLYEILKSSSRRDRRPTEVIGVTRYTKRLPVEDLRKLPLVLAAWLEARGVLNTIPIPATLDALLRIADMLYNEVFEATVTSIERGLKQKQYILVKNYGPLKVCVHRGIEEGAIVSVVEKQLNLLGVIQGCVLAVDTGTSINVLTESIQNVLSPQGYMQAVRRGCIRYIEDTIFAEARPC